MLACLPKVCVRVRVPPINEVGNVLLSHFRPTAEEVGRASGMRLKILLLLVTIAGRT